MISKFKSSMTSMMLGDLTLESLIPSVNFSNKILFFIVFFYFLCKTFLVCTSYGYFLCDYVSLCFNVPLNFVITLL